ncbi:MAG: 3-hydroxyacyl-CoA dehydrogenase [Magnetovibrio sp.]|nr:3-hydroxyacyl-CoA dehydrogenase [Magnetovibrio sp.]
MSEDKMLEGKVALVTGAGRGVGAEIAKMMASRGAKIIVNDLGGEADGEGTDQMPAMETVKAIRESGGEAEANFDSVGDFSAAKGMVEQALDHYGRIDILVNNAGILRDVIFHKMTEEDWDAVINVHLKGSFNTSRAAATYFRKQESGVFVHMTSTSGLIGNFGQANYAAAKLGIVGLSKSLALDMSRFNVRSNIISPFAWSRMIGTIPINDEAQRERVEKLRAMTPDKVAVMATALCADTARNVTGQVFAVRNNEIFLMSQHRPLRGMHEGKGWTPESIVDHAFPALETMFYPLDRSADIFSWDPV